MSMTSPWPALDYEAWSATCDTLHAHTQVLGKLAVDARAARAAAPARGAAADRARLGDARRCRRPTARARSSSPSTCTPTRPSPSTATGARSASRSRPTGRSARSRASCCEAVRGARRRRSRSTRRRRRCRGASRSTRTTSTRPTTPGRSRRYFAAATQAALVLAAFRAPYRGRSTPGQRLVGLVRPRRQPVLRACRPTRRPTTSSCATRWTRRRSPSAGGRATRATARPPSTPTPTRRRRASPTRRSRPRPRAGTTRSASTSSTGTTSSPPPTRTRSALEFARSAFRHACPVCGWDPALAASAEGTPPPRGLRTRQRLSRRRPRTGTTRCRRRRAGPAGRA